MILKIRNFCVGFMVLCCAAVMVILIANAKVSHSLQKIDTTQPEKQLQKQIKELSQPANPFIRSKSYIAFYIEEYNYINVGTAEDVKINDLIIPQQIQDLITEYCKAWEISYTLPEKFLSKKQQELWIDTGDEIFILSLDDHLIRHKISAVRMAKKN